VGCSPASKKKAAGEEESRDGLVRQSAVTAAARPVAVAARPVRETGQREEEEVKGDT
jgi:hypothetical protein